MSGKVPIRDGPAEGMETAPGGTYVWIEVVAVKRSERTPGAGLYRLHKGEYHYIGGRRSPCDGCGSIIDRREGGSERPSCPLCGAAVMSVVRFREGGA